MSTVLSEPTTRPSVERTYPYITIKNGAAVINNSRLKVIHLVIDKRVHDLSPEEMVRQHPPLTLAQVYAAFAYYYDHQEELDAEIEAGYQRAEELRDLFTPHPMHHALLEAKLRAQGHIE